MPGYDGDLNPGSIRLLELHSGVEEDPSSCSFLTLSIDDPALPAYEAVSYLWGDARDRRAIASPAGMLSVTSNSDAALRRFRHRSCARLLWMDQICIDQANLEERSAQVALMWKIFSRAERVLMWLGSDREGLAAIAKEFVEELQSRWEVPGRFLGELEEALRMENLPPRDSSKWRAYKRLMALPYFRRVWMVQEVLLASKATAFWGDVELSWLHIARAAIWGAKSSDFQDLHPIEDGGLTSEENCTMVRQLYDSNNDASDFPGSSLHWMIGVLAYREASDARDKIYAILNLVAEAERTGFVVDYTRSAMDVFRQATLHIIGLEQSLNVLQNASFTGKQRSAHSGDDDWPSWVPRWQQRYAYVCGVSSRDFLPCAGRPPSFSIQDGLETLVVSGVFVGRITHTVKPPSGGAVHSIPWVLHDFESAWVLAREFADPALDPLPVALQLVCTFLACEADHPDPVVQEDIRHEFYWAFIGRYSKVAFVEAVTLTLY